MNKLKIIYCPIGVATFHMESAQKEFNDSVELLKKIEPSIHLPNKLMLSIDDIKEYLTDSFADLIIVQNITFANAAYLTEILRICKNSQILLWTLKEPVIDGGRLRLNSLTGAFSAGNAFVNMRQDNLLYMFGSPNEKAIEKQLTDTIMAAKIKHNMQNMKLLMIGHTPQGFGFGRALDLEMAKNFGVELLTVESRELTQIAKKLSEADIQEESNIANKRMVDLDKTESKNRLDFFKLYHAYKKYIDNLGVKAIASRCWPDFFTDYGTPVCGVLGMLNDDGIAAACEADAYGALSMYIGQQITKTPTFLGDPVSLDEEENTLTFWHCGTGACSLARKDTGALTGVHPNRKIGPTMEFGFKPSEKATIFRIGRKPDGSFRFLILEAAILDKPKQFLGTSMVVKVEPKVKELVSKMVKAGFEPHFAIIYDNVVKTLKILAEMLQIEIWSY
jgi:L-fucose isomerase-like protein